MPEGSQVFDDHGGDSLLEVDWDNRHDIFSVDAYNRRNIGLLDSYLTWTYERESMEGHRDWLLDRPFLARTVIENWLKTDEEKWETLTLCLGLPKPRVRIIYVLGEPGSGKSTFAYDLARRIQELSGRPIVERGDSDDTPDFVEGAIDVLQHAPHGAVVIDNEAALNQGSRNTQTKEGKALNPVVATIRHNDLIGIWVSQNSKLADPTLYNMAQMLVFKPLGLTQAGSERGPLRRTIKYWRELMPREPSETFVLSKHVQPMRFQRAAPAWYTDQHSTSYARLTREAAIHIAARRRSSQAGWEAIATRLSHRYEPKHWTFWRDEVLKMTGGIDPATGKPPGARKKKSQVTS